MPTLLLRPPPASMANGIVTHIADARDSCDFEKAQQQHIAYGNIFRQHGWTDVVSVDRDDTLPDSVFVEDGVVSVQRIDGERGGNQDSEGIMILTSPGTQARAREVDGIEQALQAHQGSPSLQSRCIEHIRAPGTLDGGDVLKVPRTRTIYVGDSMRTNEEGRRQFAALVSPLGWTVKAVPVKKALHLKSMLTALPDGTIIGYRPFVEDTSVFDEFIAMPEPDGVAVVHLDPRGGLDSPLLMSASAPQSTALLRDLGYTAITTDITEFERLEGCVTCLSVRVR